MFVFVCAVCSFQVVSSFVLFGECVYVCCSMGVMPEIKIYIHYVLSGINRGRNS